MAQIKNIKLHIVTDIKLIPITMENETVEGGNETTLTKQQLKNKKKREAAKRKKLAASGDVAVKIEAQDDGGCEAVIIQKEKNDTTSTTSTTTITQKTATVTATPSTTTTEGENEVDNFEEELCWCIQQIQIGLQSGKPSKDQATKSKKLMDQLKSNKTSKPKKRMLMRTTFGDYRAKMEKENKQVVNVKPAKFVDVDDKVMNQSTFYRKKANDLPAAFRVNDQEFRFNFAESVS